MSEIAIIMDAKQAKGSAKTSISMGLAIDLNIMDVEETKVSAQLLMLSFYFGMS